MPGETIRVEELSSGLRAAFVNLPHFRTHAARLTINSGSMHESPEEYGGAHFLEHTAFQGTKDLPSEEAVHRYSEDKGLSKNAVTKPAYTSYVADGYELESVGFMVIQLALRPSLNADALEGERRPIIDEVRGFASSPYYLPNLAHARIARGEVYARPVGGTVEDVQNMTPEALRALHARHYRVSNAVLVTCSPEPIERQREYAESVTSDILADSSEDNPVPIRPLDFNPGGVSASLQQVDLPLSAQTSVNIGLDMPETTSAEEHINHSIISTILARAAHNRLRREMSLCYGAGASLAKTADLHFGRDKNWAHLTVSANLNGEDSITGLTALRDDVLRAPLSGQIFESVLVSLERDIDHVMESNPSQVADRIANILALARSQEISLTELKDIAATVSLDNLRTLHRDIVDTKPLVIATSPDPKVLEAIGEWASAGA